ncbi:MAG: glutamate--tRNA ligase [Candidatus Omnitrophica bacterium]|nr:glutamate--tRNA ligase [Candidatus Omnitrophota bacterium]
MVKVRFAPSPTGFLHVGGARTALFNWMYAKAQKGKFLLRIEDTDQQRSKQEYVDEILDSMTWLGLDWDELIYQSQRFDIYKEHALKLVSEGKAYQDGDAILLKMPKQEVKFWDLIRGEIVFDTASFVVWDEESGSKTNETGEAQLKDEVLLKSDGSPAYNFCCVVDDVLMEITHVVRGEDHISNTPRQLIVYQSLGFKPPKFAHLPLITGADGKRLSKRTGAVAVSAYRKMGFLPEATMNFLMLLGWSPGNNQEMMSMKNAVQKFSVKKINKTAAVFDMDKFRWLNGQYIKQADPQYITSALIPLLKEHQLVTDDVDPGFIKEAVTLYQSRLPTLMDFLDRARYLFLEKVEIEQEAKETILAKDRTMEFQLLADRLHALDAYDKDSAEKSFRAVVDELGLKASDLVHPVRVALTGSAVGPGLFETMALLGKSKTVYRLKNFTNE